MLAPGRNSMASVEGHASPAGIIVMLKLRRADVSLALDLQRVLPADEYILIFIIPL